ncbi:alcohol dehydrogenase catalytic domain-containing protein [Catellatospora vulcania]|uniref:alcohol dehydrogenase catalytic domain-containing protein n=1 Tax=Catellatospora vulcania TaxID=1460450 RepID=UPI0012D43D75|nr:alcohol dehydrogenase catalytic domain-containing protein [Catellatospora vulcania]
MSTMQAVRAHARGGPEQLVYEQAPRPEPGHGDVLVAVKAASMTPDELTWPETWTYTPDGSGPERTPVTPSHEFSGVVAATGAGVDRLQVQGPPGAEGRDAAQRGGRPC